MGFKTKFGLQRGQKTVKAKKKERRKGRGREEEEKRRRKGDKKGMETNLEYGI